MKQYDVTIIGAGIIGLATALKLLEKHPLLKVAVIDKEDTVAAHQTGHNSGVIHQGVYYKPGSFKARNCLKGVKELYTFCDQHQIPYQKCGKVIVASSKEELPRLHELEKRGQANGVLGLTRIGPERLKEIEPSVQAVEALYSPNTGIIDYRFVAKKYAEILQSKGADLFLGHKVEGIKTSGKEVIITTPRTELTCAFLINCGGYFADKLAHQAHKEICNKQIIPFRGEYFEITSEKKNLINGLIYPVPDPRFPFLGVHITRMINGSVEAGPNAVLALSREGYFKTSFSFEQLWDLATYPGFWRMALKNWKIGFYELYRSFSKKTFLQDIQRLVPSIEDSDLTPTKSGVRSQLVLKDGTIYDDFEIVRKGNIVHVLSAPSPGATASLAIGEQIACLYDDEQ